MIARAQRKSRSLRWENEAASALNELRHHRAGHPSQHAREIRLERLPLLENRDRAHGEQLALFGGELERRHYDHREMAQSCLPAYGPPFPPRRPPPGALIRSGTFAHCAGVSIVCAASSVWRAVVRPLSNSGRIDAKSRAGSGFGPARVTIARIESATTA